MKRFQDGFSVLLDGLDLEILENDPNSIYGLSKDLTLNYLNPGWFNFAKENDGEPTISERFNLGSHIGDSITGPARDYYLEVFQRILNTGEIWHHEYECSTPEILRIYCQTVHPLYNRNGLLIVNRLVKEQPHDLKTRRPHKPIEKHYIQKTGLITQCCNCRRVKRVANLDVWDWVPAWVKKVPRNTSHTFCPKCYEYYFKIVYKVS
jgi:hypothetical protein